MSVDASAETTSARDNKISTYGFAGDLGTAAAVCKPVLNTNTCNSIMVIFIVGCQNIIVLDCRRCNQNISITSE